MFTIISDPYSYVDINNDPLPYCDPAELSNMYITPDDSHFIPVPVASTYFSGYSNVSSIIAYEVVGAFDGVAIDVIDADKILMMCLTATTPSVALNGFENFFEGWTLYAYIFAQIFTGLIRPHNIINSTAGFSVTNCNHDNFLVISSSVSSVVRGTSSSNGTLGLTIVTIILAMVVICIIAYLLVKK